MTTRLANAYGTEQDKVNCSFYFKIGACRHGDKCSRKHIKPNYSQTILCSNLWLPHVNPELEGLSPREQDKKFDEFFEDFFIEACKFGEVEEVIVCENSNDHLMGNVYARYKYEEDAKKAVENLNSRWFDGRPVYCELSPVTNFKEACCRQHDTHECNRGGACNFIHQKRPNHSLLRDLRDAQRKFRK